MKVVVKKNDKYIYIIKTIKYLVKFRIWITEDYIYKTNVKTNKVNEFEINENKEEEIYIDELNGNNIINNYLNLPNFFLLLNQY